MNSECLWCNAPCLDRYCEAHETLGLRLDEIDESLANVRSLWKTNPTDELSRVIASLEKTQIRLYMLLGNIE